MERVKSQTGWQEFTKASDALINFTRMYGRESVVCDAPTAGGVRMEYPNEWRHLEAIFLKVPTHPELVRVRTFNWRAEDEVSGYFPRKRAEMFYRHLVKLGFKQERL